MKFLACSRCFSSANSNSSSSSQSRRRRNGKQPVQEITNPLVVTKRPVAKLLQPQANTASRKKRFPAVLTALTSWRTRPTNTQQERQQQQHQTNIRKTVRVIESPARRPAQSYYRRAPSKTQRLIRMYEERAQSPEKYNQEHLIDPPASFSGADDSFESHQNFKNKLNTLDFKRMNTVGVEQEPLSSSSKSATYKKNSYNEIESSGLLPVSKFARKTLLEDFLKERQRIEQTMIDLLNGNDPGSIILRKRNEDYKKVRFEDEKEEDERDTEIKLSVDPDTKVEDFYVERKMTFLKDKTVEDKALVVKIGKKNGPGDDDDDIGMTRSREMVFRNFGLMTL